MNIPKRIVQRLLTRQEGVALTIVLLLTAVILSLGIFGSRSARTELQIARNELLSKKALPIAEAGINHAFGLLKSETDFDDEISSGIGGALAGLGSSTTLDGTSYLFKAFSGSGTSDGYYVRVEDNYDDAIQTTDADSTIKVISRGRIGNAERIIEALVQVKMGPDCAIVSNGPLTISGNPSISGDQGCAQSNQDMTISGNPSFDEGPTASGTMSISGTPDVDGTTIGSSYASSNSGQPTVSVPTVRLLNFNGINLANEVNAAGGYRLDDNCKVYQGGTWTCSENGPDCDGGTEVEDLNVTSPWNGWTCSPNNISVPSDATCDDSSCANSLWTVSGSSPGNGVFFVEGWVNISGTPSNWSTTIIAMNSIDISGNPTMTPFVTTGNLKNVLLVSGNDVGMGGNPSANGYIGAIFAHQQIKFNGNPKLTGFAIAECGGTTWTGDPAPNDTSEKDVHTGPPCYDIPGDVTITYNGLDSALYPGSLTLVSWNEVRN